MSNLGAPDASVALIRPRISRTSTTGASASIAFYGNAIALYGGTGPDHGAYAVALDGVPATIKFNGSAPVARYQELLVRTSASGRSVDSLVLAVLRPRPFHRQSRGRYLANGLFQHDNMVGPGHDHGEHLARCFRHWRPYVVDVNGYAVDVYGYAPNRDSKHFALGIGSSGCWIKVLFSQSAVCLG